MVGLHPVFRTGSRGKDPVTKGSVHIAVEPGERAACLYLDGNTPAPKMFITQKRANIGGLDQVSGILGVAGEAKGLGVDGVHMGEGLRAERLKTRRPAVIPAFRCLRVRLPPTRGKHGQQTVQPEFSSHCSLPIPSQTSPLSGIGLQMRLHEPEPLVHAARGFRASAMSGTAHRTLSVITVPRQSERH